MTTRRDALKVLPLVCAPSLALAQIPKFGEPKRIGVLSVEEDRRTPTEERPFWIALSKKGWVLGKNLLVEPAYADGKPERLQELAEELIRKRVDVILSGRDEILAAARATRTIPIVCIELLWPVEQGLIDSNARPGRNVTGLTVYTGIEVGNKRLQFLREIVPAAKRLSWLWGLNSISVETLAGSSVDMASVSEAAAKSMGFETKFHIARTTGDLDAVFADMIDWHAQAVLAAGRPVWEARQHVAELALRHRLPSAFVSREHVEAGGLLSYGIPASEWDRIGIRQVEYVDRILRGALPADLPVERPNRYELVINMKTAKALGVTIPQSVLLRADEVIQ